MDKQFLFEVFNAYFGHVYRYIGTIPEGETIDHYVTGKFISVINDHDCTTTVVDLEDRGGILIYVNKNVEINDDDFEFIEDMEPVYTPREEYEPAPIPDPLPPAPTGPTGGNQ